MPERPDEQGLFAGQIGGNWLADIEAVNKQRPVFVGPGWQCSGSRLDRAQNALSLEGRSRR